MGRIGLFAIFRGRRLLFRCVGMLVLAAALILSGVPRAQGALQEYRDWSMGTMGMIAQSIAYDQARLYVLGESSTPGIYQVGMLISGDPTQFIAVFSKGDPGKLGKPCGNDTDCGAAGIFGEPSFRGWRLPRSNLHRPVPPG